MWCQFPHRASPLAILRRSSTRFVPASPTPTSIQSPIRRVRSAARSPGTTTENQGWVDRVQHGARRAPRLADLVICISVRSCDAQQKTVGLAAVVDVASDGVALAVDPGTGSANGAGKIKGSEYALVVPIPAQQKAVHRLLERAWLGITVTADDVAARIDANNRR